MKKEKQEIFRPTEQQSTLTRRDMLLGLGAASAAIYSGNVLSAEDMKHHHEVHDHSKHSAQMPGVLDAVNVCLDKGQRCISHCIVAWGEGDQELAACLAKAQEMRAICDAFSYLLASNSSHISEYAKICSKVCKECEKECLKHDKHIECKNCAEACVDVVDQIKLHIA